MIRINLLGVERQTVRKSTFLDANQRTSLACSLVLILAMAGVGFWYWSLSNQTARLDMAIASARQETVRLKAVLEEVKRAEERRADLQERVGIIEDLRRGQNVPVQLLDHVSRSVPDMLWLTALDQKDDAVSIEGRTTTLISLADFVANLGTNRLVSKPIDIVNSEVESSAATANSSLELIKFSVKAPLAPNKPEADATAGRGGKPGVAAASGRGGAQNAAPGVTPAGAGAPRAAR